MALAHGTPVASLKYSFFPMLLESSLILPSNSTRFFRVSSLSYPFLLGKAFILKLQKDLDPSLKSPHSFLSKCAVACRYISHLHGILFSTACRRDTSRCLAHPHGPWAPETCSVSQCDASRWGGPRQVGLIPSVLDVLVALFYGCGRQQFIVSPYPHHLAGA